MLNQCCGMLQQLWVLLGQIQCCPRIAATLMITLLYHNNVATSPHCCGNAVTMLENYIMLWHCYNTASSYHKIHQHCVTVLWTLMPKVDIQPNKKIQTMLCERWCPTLNSDISSTWRNYVIFNLDTTLIQHCRNKPRMSISIVHFRNKVENDEINQFALVKII